jgi:hypothetical protein
MEAGGMRISILDDWFDTLRTSSCGSELRPLVFLIGRILARQRPGDEVVELFAEEIAGSAWATG